MFAHDGGRKADNPLEASGFDLDYVDSILDRLGACLRIRLHPANLPSKSLVHQISRSRNIRMDDQVDVYAGFDSVDVLVSDYSSLIYDFMLTGKPVVQIGFDLAEYLSNSRDMYYRYQEISVTPDIDSWTGVLELIIQMASEGAPPLYRDNYARVARLFNGPHPEKTASQNIVEEVVARIGVRLPVCST